MAAPLTPGRKPKVLFFSEAVTLAHVARPAVLGGYLDATRYDIHMAQHPRYRALLGELPVTFHDLDSIEPGQFMQALANGDPVYSEQTLREYVEADSALIGAVQPDVIVGDFRISLQVSARLAGVPFITITNAYWSDHVRQRYVVPDLPFTRWLGPRVGQSVFSLVRPVAFALHCRPMNAVRRHYGLPAIGSSLQRVYTEADYTLYADAQELFDMHRLPSGHRFIGPVVWSPSAPQPQWWDALDDRPRVYVTLGSSGQASLLPKVIEAFDGVPVNVLVSTAGAPLPGVLPPNVYAAPYLDGTATVAGAALVVCNGGSPTTQQALTRAVPVIGLASNLDQYLNMSMVERQGAGVCLRAGHTSAVALRAAIDRVLDDPEFAAHAAQLAGVFDRYDSASLFSGVIDEALNVTANPAAEPVAVRS